jgi:phosphoserine phosphatase
MKYKLVVFDLDGTIVDNIESVWETLHEFFGIDSHPERLGVRKKFFSGEISYQEWAEKDIELMKKSGADREKIMKALGKAKLTKNAIETIEELRKRGYKIAIISGSMDILLEKLIPDYERIFDHVFINRVRFGREGRITKVEPTPFDQERKKSGLVRICDLEKIKPEECVFVGDHYNDVEIAKLAGFSIAFNSKSAELNEIADVVVEKKDLKAILKYL